MKNNEGIVLAVLAVVLMAASGCASKEMVKKEEPIVTATQKPHTEALKPPPAAVTKQIVTQPKMEQINPLEAQKAKASKAAAAMETVYFDFDKADLSKAARDVLTVNAATILKEMPDASIMIEGNCDQRGSAEYNLALGERRAKSSLQYLITLGVPADRLSVISYGKEKPAVKGDNEAAWGKNRRDDFVVQKTVEANR